MTIPLATLQALCTEAGLDVTRVLSATFDRHAVTFTVASMGPDGRIYGNRDRSEIVTHWVRVPVQD